MSRKTLLVPLLVAVVTACAKQPSTVAEVRSAQTQPPPVEVLRSWDAQRAVAWARGDPRRLAALYTPGSVAGRHDRVMLQSWADRGLVVRGMRTQLLAVHELARTRSTWTLQVTDRLVGGLAVGPGVRRPLPRDGATTRTVRLRLVGGAWVVASVRPEEVMPQAD